MTDDNQITALCRVFLDGGYSIEECVSEFSDSFQYLDQNKLRQLLTYLSSAENKGDIKSITVYPVLDGRYGYNPPNDKLLIVELPKPPRNGIMPDGSIIWGLEPERYSPSGGNYVCTRADIRRH